MFQTEKDMLYFSMKIYAFVEWIVDHNFNL